jgi:hypothetical protein
MARKSHLSRPEDQLSETKLLDNPSATTLCPSRVTGKRRTKTAKQTQSTAHNGLSEETPIKSAPAARKTPRKSSTNNTVLRDAKVTKTTQRKGNVTRGLVDSKGGSARKSAVKGSADKADGFC